MRRLRDPLTGLGNREVFAAASRELTAARSRSVVLVDLDQFKAVNDTYGHLNGDQVLQVVGDRLRSRLESAAHLAQLRSLGCHVGQGYYFAKPGPADSLQFEDLGRVSA